MADLFTVEELRVLNEVERRMDRGDPLGALRWRVAIRESGDHEGARPGTDHVVYVRGNSQPQHGAHCQEQIAYERGQRLIAE